MPSDLSGDGGDDWIETVLTAGPGAAPVDAAAEKLAAATLAADDDDDDDDDDDAAVGGGNILRTRTYDVSLTYDKSPRRRRRRRSLRFPDV